MSRQYSCFLEKKEGYVVRFNSLVDKLHAANKVKASVFNSAKLQYEEFTNYVNIQCKNEFLKFNVLSDRLDTFLRFYLSNKTEYESLWSICILVFTLSHGQISIERGFSINKEILVENLETKSLIAQRLVYNNLKSEQIKSHVFHITPECRKNCKLANGRYKFDLRKLRRTKR